MSNPKLEYGAVIVRRGRHKGRIGEYDDDESRSAIVYFGHPLMVGQYFLIKKSDLEVPTVPDLLRRREAIWTLISPFNSATLTCDQRYTLLVELEYVSGILSNRFIDGEFTRASTEPIKVFLCHTSADKPFVRQVAHDLRARGYGAWLDEVEIKAGQSLIAEISKGITESRYMLVFFSTESASSQWMKIEYYNKLIEEIRRNQVSVIPVMIDDCEIPVPLRDKKYADFRKDYSDGLREVLSALGHFSDHKKVWSEFLAGGENIRANLVQPDDAKTQPLKPKRPQN
jgi:hypothetical protein